MPDGPIDPTKCAPLALSGLYRVAVNDYIAGGGSGFEVLKRNTSKQDTGISLRDSLRIFLNKSSPCGDRMDTVVNPPVAIRDTYGDISCLDATIEPHDGRIRPVFE